MKIPKLFRGGVHYIRVALGVGSFRIRKFLTRLTFPYKFHQILKSDNNCSTDFNNAIKIISSLRQDNGSFCREQYDPSVHDDNKWTIIIPVYNVEDYIEECLDSILSQKTTYDYLIHIIDDGSTDSTLSKVEAYASKFRCIRVSTQKNSSQSVARNNALNRCDSEWVMMVDGDDVLAENAIQTLMDVAIENKCDVVEGQVKSFYGEFEKEGNTAGGACVAIKSSSDQKYILTSKGYSCGKLYRRSLWENVRYPERYIFEDIITKYIVCRKAVRYARSNQVVYGYRMRQNSSSHTADNRKLDCLWVMDKVQVIRENNNIPNDVINHTLMMNHFGMLTPLMVCGMDYKYQQAALRIAREYLVKWNVARSGLPYFFRKSYDAIMALNVEAWMLTYKTIADYRFIENSREIN